MGVVHEGLRFFGKLNSAPTPVIPLERSDEESKWSPEGAQASQPCLRLPVRGLGDGGSFPVPTGVAHEGLRFFGKLRMTEGGVRITVDGG